MRTATALAALIAFTQPAAAQLAESGAASQAIAIVGGGGGGSAGRVQGLATTPDAVAPSSSTAMGGGSCMVPATSDAVSVAFLGYSGARWALDEACEARAQAAAFVGIAYARAELLGDRRGAARTLDMAERRLSATQAQFLAAAGNGPWPEFWRP